MHEFLLELDALLKKHDATLFYTTDDDGIHMIVGDEEATAWLDDVANNELLDLARQYK